MSDAPLPRPSPRLIKVASCFSFSQSAPRDPSENRSIESFADRSKPSLRILFLGWLQFWIFDAIHFNFGNLQCAGLRRLVELAFQEAEDQFFSGELVLGFLSGLAVSTAASTSDWAAATCWSRSLARSFGDWRPASRAMRGPHAFLIKSLFERQRWCHR